MGLRTVGRRRLAFLPELTLSESVRLDGDPAVLLFSFHVGHIVATVTVSRAVWISVIRATSSVKRLVKSYNVAKLSASSAELSNRLFLRC
jgi:hypothetical protein